MPSNISLKAGRAQVFFWITHPPPPHLLRLREPMLLKAFSISTRSLGSNHRFEHRLFMFDRREGSQRGSAERTKQRHCLGGFGKLPIIFFARGIFHERGDGNPVSGQKSHRESVEVSQRGHGLQMKKFTWASTNCQSVFSNFRF